MEGENCNSRLIVSPNNNMHVLLTILPAYISYSSYGTRWENWLKHVFDKISFIFMTCLSGKENLDACHYWGLRVKRNCIRRMCCQESGS